MGHPAARPRQARLLRLVRRADRLHERRGERSDEDLWPADLHLIGKEILRFHAVFWPAFLMAADLPLPKRIFAHGWLLFENDKMSKSRGNIVRAEPIRQVMGVDALRYFLLREIVFGQDGSFSYDALIGRYNSELANGLGNLASRTLTMIHQYRGGVIPAPADVAYRCRRAARSDQLRVPQFFDASNSRAASKRSGRLLSAVDQFIVQQAPWKLAKRPTTRRSAATRRHLYTAAEALRIATALLHPVMPESDRQDLEPARHDRAARIGAPDALDLGPVCRPARRSADRRRLSAHRRERAPSRRCASSKPR